MTPTPASIGPFLTVASPVFVEPPYCLGHHHLAPRPMRGFFFAMARTYLVFGDIEGKLDVLRVECTKCSRKGRYPVHKLIEKSGSKANMMKWKEQLKGGCPRRDAHGPHERCDLICPDLPRVL